MEFTDSFDTLVKSDSKYLRKEDAGEDGIVVTIAGFSREDVGEGADVEERTVVHFVEDDVKSMILNKTNSQLIPICTGAKTPSEAIGKQIIVFSDPTVSFGGKIVGGLRIRRAPQKGEPGADDDIPF